MRILYVVHQLLPPRHVAGTEIYSQHLARAMQARGHEVEVYFTESYPDREQYEISRGTWEGLPYHEAIFRHQFDDFESTYRNERMEQLFEQVLDATRPDVVHIQHLALHSIGYIDQIHARQIPIVYTLHEYLLMCPRDGQLLRPGLELCAGPEPAACARCVTHLPAPSQSPDLESAIVARGQAIRARLELVDRFISPSAYLRQRFIDASWIEPSRILHSDNGFDLSAFQTAAARPAPSDILAVGYIGTIADYKGVDVLIDAFAQIDSSAARCEIWGDLETFPDYGKRLQEMTKPHSLQLKGRFPNTEVGKVLRNLDVLVVPSLWYENSPLTIHEAFLAGIPVIATDHGGMAELVEHEVTGLLFERGNAQDLARQIRRVIEEPALRERLQGAKPNVKAIADDAATMEMRYESLLDAAH